MIGSAQEFVHLRNSNLEEEYTRAAQEEASLHVWREIIELYPDYKIWVVYNKTVPLEILEKLVSDDDPKVRSAVARKRKISPLIIDFLADDSDEQVRYSLACNTNLTMESLLKINRQGSDWFKGALEEIIAKKKAQPSK